MIELFYSDIKWMYRPAWAVRSCKQFFLWWGIYSETCHLSQNPWNIMIFDTTCDFRVFKLIGWFSEYDFWIPGEISRRHRWSKNIFENFSDSKKKLTKNIFENLKILTFENFGEILIEHFSLTILIIRSTNFDRKFRFFDQNFWKKKVPKK